MSELTYASRLEELLDTLSVLKKSKNYDEIIRLIETAYLIEQRLKQGENIALRATHNGYIQKWFYKSLANKFPLNEWLLAAGTKSVDYSSVLEALQNDRTD